MTIAAVQHWRLNHACAGRFRTPAKAMADLSIRERHPIAITLVEVRVRARSCAPAFRNSQ